MRNPTGMWGVLSLWLLGLVVLIGCRHTQEIKP